MPKIRRKRLRAHIKQTTHPAHADWGAEVVTHTPVRYRSLVLKAVAKVNLMRPVCNAMFGHEHSLMHRMATGVVVAGIGVVIAKHKGHSSNEIIAYAGDAVGYGLHGLGLTPLVEAVAKAYEEV